MELRYKPANIPELKAAILSTLAEHAHIEEGIPFAYLAELIWKKTGDKLQFMDMDPLVKSGEVTTGRLFLYFRLADQPTGGV